MIGDKRLDMPENCTDMSKIFQYIGFDESKLEGSIGFIQYIASKFVEINNEVYDKLHLYDKAIENEVWRDKVD